LVQQGRQRLRYGRGSVGFLHHATRIHDKVVLKSGSGENMLQKLVLAFAILALVMAFAGSVPAPGSSFRVRISQPSVVKGAELQPGEYRVNLGAEKVTFVAGKTVVDASAKIETGNEKFPTTSVRYSTETGKAVISEIRIGGTATRLVFNP
jgi:hypothetical protein